MRRPRASFFAFAFLFAFGAIGCSKPDATTSPSPADLAAKALDAATSNASAAAAASSSSAVPEAHLSPHADVTGAPAACRAMVVQGDVKIVAAAPSADAGGADRGAPSPLTDPGDAGSAVGSLELLDPNGVIVVGTDSRVQVKSARTGRESALAGPARARLCVDGSDEIWLAQGKLSALGAAGAGPGSELLVVTAYGVVRVPAANVNVVVDDKGMHVSGASSPALVWTPDKPSFTAMTPGTTRDVSTKPSLAEARAVCERSAATAEAMAKSVAAASSAVGLANAGAPRGGAGTTSAADAGLGDLAARHVEARQLARVACKVARIRVDTETRGAEKRAGEQALDRADDRWTRLP